MSEKLNTEDYLFYDPAVNDWLDLSTLQIKRKPFNIVKYAVLLQASDNLNIHHINGVYSDPPTKYNCLNGEYKFAAIIGLVINNEGGVEDAFVYSTKEIPHYPYVV